ncbi:hypothetical protein QQP08_015080 [Theobroma cacao]|nr:hypothetical protein QQP08_015080 [Theobroma cacao]
MDLEEVEEEEEIHVEEVEEEEEIHEEEVEAIMGDKVVMKDPKNGVEFVRRTIMKRKIVGTKERHSDMIARSSILCRKIVSLAINNKLPEAGTGREVLVANVTTGILFEMVCFRTPTDPVPLTTLGATNFFFIFSKLCKIRSFNNSLSSKFFLEEGK